MKRWRMEPRGFHRPPHPNPLPAGEGAAYCAQLLAGAQPSEPSNPNPANLWLCPPKPAERTLLLPPGEGRDEGRLRLPSLHGSWSLNRSFLNTRLSMKRRRMEPRGFHRAPHPNPLPAGEGVAYHPQLLAGAQPSEPSNPNPANLWLCPTKPAERVLLLPPGEGRDEGRLRSSSLQGSWPLNRSFLNTRLSMKRRRMEPRGFSPTPSPQPSPDGRGSRVLRATSRWSPTVRAVKSQSSEPLALPYETGGARSPSPPGRRPG